MAKLNIQKIKHPKYIPPHTQSNNASSYGISHNTTPPSTSRMPPNAGGNSRQHTQYSMKS